MKGYLIALLVLSPAMAIAMATDGHDGNGGDSCENRIKIIRDDISSWIHLEGSSQLELPEGISVTEYNKRMLAQIENAEISCTQEKILVKGVEKTCKNFNDSNVSHIVCQFDRFMNQTSEEDQYKLVHHEFAGLAKLEVTTDTGSDYTISNQISGFLENRTEKRLAVRAGIPEVGHYVSVTQEFTTHLFVTKLSDQEIQIERIYYNDRSPSKSNVWCTLKEAIYRRTQDPENFELITNNGSNGWSRHRIAYTFSKDFKSMQENDDTDAVFILLSRSKNDILPTLLRLLKLNECQQAPNPFPPPPPPAPLDPIVLDMNGNGFSFGPIRNDFEFYRAKPYHIAYDEILNPFYNTGWSLDPDDGFLVFSRNAGKLNDKITYADQFIGDRTRGPFEETYKLGTEWLQIYDLDRNGIINAKDPIFPFLSIWIDRNLNGTTDDYEMRSLLEYNITSINISELTAVNKKDQYGNETLNMGSASSKLGPVQFVEVNLQTHSYDYILKL